MNTKIKIISTLLLTLSLVHTACAFDAVGRPYSSRPDVKLMIDEMVSEHGFNRTSLVELFDGVKHQAQVIKAYSKPAERAMSWNRYRTIFVKQKRIDLGVAFWKKNQQLLARAEQSTGVPAEIIVAIIGVESRFGSNKGKNKALDSLTTLAFEREKRSDFFRNELKEFLLLCREQGFNPRTVTGSYAGAMGVPQFISSSYRNYAVDFDGDGKIDLFNSVPDVVGSVANYFKVHGWKTGGRVVSDALRVQPKHDTYAAGKGRQGLKPTMTMGEFAQRGINASPRIATNEKLTLLKFDDEAQGMYKFGHTNFYVITRYNQSSMYALAVHQLSQRIKTNYLKKK